MDIRRDVLGILVGGLPGPGINAAINAIVIEAHNRDLVAVGFLAGWKHLKKGLTSKRRLLEVSDVTPSASRGGSIIGLSKEQLDKAMDVDNALRALQHLRVRYLVVIGGANTAESAHKLAIAARDLDADLSLVDVPISIFNDLPLPTGCIMFGYDTARDFGVNLVQNLSKDAKALGRYYLVQVIGSRSGHLALGISMSANATNCYIPEEFKNDDDILEKLTDMVDTTILKRVVEEKPYGVILISEGIVDLLNEKELDLLSGGSVDKGHEVLIDFLRARLEKRYEERNYKVFVRTKKIGFEIRAVDPNSLDRERAMQIGYGAVSALLRGDNGIFVTLQGDELAAVSISSLLDSKTGHSCVRTVDLQSLKYEVANKYMIRLNRGDLTDSGICWKLSNFCNMTQSAFQQRFDYLTRTPI